LNFVRYSSIEHYLLQLPSSMHSFCFVSLSFRPVLFASSPYSHSIPWFFSSILFQ
jgi:hypothetical protein